MSLSNTYAAVLQECKTKDELEKVLIHMKSKGHISLLSQVMNILERMPEEEKATLTVKDKDDAKKYLSEITKVGGEPENTNVVVDSRIVGNYVARKGGTLVDSSYRKQLVELYQNTVTQKYG